MTVDADFKTGSAFQSIPGCKAAILHLKDGAGEGKTYSGASRDCVLPPVEPLKKMRKFLRRNTIVFGEPYRPRIAGRRPTAEENQRIADEVLARSYAWGREET